jgi:uncharacterized protein (TIGR02118 family)
MAKLIALYKTPVDPAAFDAYYFESHLPVARGIAGLTGYEVSRGPVVSPLGDSPYHMVATLSFASMDALRAALISPTGQAAAADLANFATGGVELLVFDDEAI